MTAVVAGVVLHVEDESVNFDDSQAPHVQWQATCTVPDTQEQMDKLDPRLRPRALVTVGDQTLDLVLTSSEIDRPSNTMRIEAESDERVLMDYGSGQDTLTFRPQHEAYQSIMIIVRNALPSAKFMDYGVRAYGFVTDPEEPLVVAPGDDALQAVWEIADRAGDRWVYNDGQVWRLTTRPELASSAKADLRTGETGNILSSSSGRGRDDWYNSVHVIYRWTTEDEVDGKTVRTERYADGWASVMSGPFDVRAVGRRVQRIERNYAGTTASAQAAAQSLLRRSVTRGRSVDLEAIADYRLRPGDTVAVTLPLGATEKHLISSITFNNPAGTMNITTRVPNDAAIKTGA
jgi:protein involved in polysaccharide export with SLBB domain